MRTLGPTIAPGVGTALAGMSDNRAYYIFSGDLNQMGIIERFLRERAYPVVKANVYPGFAKDQEEKFKDALKLIFEFRVEGWWRQELNMVKYGICSQEKFNSALGRE